MAVANYSSQHEITEIHVFPFLKPSALPPINRIPVELLGDIFSWCRYIPNANSEPLSSPNCRVTLTDFDTLGADAFTQVCRHWRRVALAIPTLWSSITMVMPKRSDLATIQLWLRRSGTSPLYISLAVPTDTSVTQDLFDILITEVHRWKTIYFVFLMPIEPSLLKLPNEALRQLESVELCCLILETADVARYEQCWDVMFAPSSLRKVTVDWIHIKSTAAVRPWQKLTALGLENVIISPALLETLRSCPQPYQPQTGIQEHCLRRILPSSAHSACSSAPSCSQFTF